MSLSTEQGLFTMAAVCWSSVRARTEPGPTRRSRPGGPAATVLPQSRGRGGADAGRRRLVPTPTVTRNKPHSRPASPQQLHDMR